MLLLQGFSIALQMLRLHKLRSFLTMLGVIIGVFSVTIIVMMSGGFEAYLTAEFKKLGADTIVVFFDPGRRERGQTFGNIEGLKNSDLDYIKSRVPEIEIGSLGLMVPASEIKYGDKSIDKPQVSGTDEHFSELNRIGLLEGRYLNATDVKMRNNVALIGQDIRDRLFAGQSPIGKFIVLKGITLEVIGVLEKMDFGPDSTGRMVLTPITTAQDKWIGGNNVSYLTVRPKKGFSVEKATQHVWEALMLKSNNKPIYRVDSRESILKVFGGVIGVAGAVLAAIAALSLLVGGIGIMNIMLVSVTERTREIGLRKAVGATRSAVLSQFLVEAATLSLVGGLIGMFCAWSFGTMVSFLTATREWPSKGGLETPFPVAAAIVAMAFSALIGVVFGFYPAVRAANLSPIDALRSE